MCEIRMHYAMCKVRMHEDGDVMGGGPMHEDGIQAAADGGESSGIQKALLLILLDAEKGWY